MIHFSVSNNQAGPFTATAVEGRSSSRWKTWYEESEATLKTWLVLLKNWPGLSETCTTWSCWKLLLTEKILLHCFHATVSQLFLIQLLTIRHGWAKQQRTGGWQTTVLSRKNVFGQLDRWNVHTIDFSSLSLLFTYIYKLTIDQRLWKLSFCIKLSVS